MDKLASVLLLRGNLVEPPAGAKADDRFARELETEAAAFGWVFTPALRAAVANVPKPVRVAWGDWLLAVLQGDVGGDRPWVPLFRRFPHASPRETDRLYVERMLAAYFQDDGPLCVLCGQFDTVQPVAPCGHLVCRSCFDPGAFSACPICNRRLDPMDPYMTIPAPSSSKAGKPIRLKRLDLGDASADAIRVRDGLARQSSPLNDAERDDLLVLVRATSVAGDLSWASEIPSRETKAILTANALATVSAENRSATVAQVAAMWSTATDVARTLWTISGGQPNLWVPRDRSEAGGAFESWRPEQEKKEQVPIPRIVPLSRGLRRAALARLNSLPMPNLIEDVLRHPTVWKRIAERLHPFEHSARYPRASVAFSVLRESGHAPESSQAAACLAAERAGWVRVVHRNNLVGARALTLRVRVEAAFQDGNAGAALELLRPSPGDLLRRLDHLARLWTDDPAPLVDAARQAARVASPRVALGARASIELRDRVESAPARKVEEARQRDAAQGDGGDRARPSLSSAQVESPGTGRSRRTFFPRGGAAFTWSSPDERPLLASGLPELLVAAIDDAIRSRAGELTRFDVAVIDTALRNVPLPSGTQSASGSSLALPRGTLMPIPGEVDTLRMFLHWVDPPDVRVDLDLSAVLFDQNWNRLDHCDYTRLRSGLGAVHSGDLTSAPAPMGATEFLDLDLASLRSSGVVWVIPVVFSYNDVPFENLEAAIAGVGRPFPGQYFDPAGVLVRYDLRGDSRTSLPFIANLVDGSLRWLDLHLPSRGYAHSVGTRGDRLAETVADLESLYSGSTRPDAFTLALLHAEARASKILLRDDGEFVDLDGQRSSPPDLGQGRTLFVCVDDAPDPAAMAPGSVVASVMPGPSGADDLNELLTALVVNVESDR